MRGILIICFDLLLLKIGLIIKLAVIVKNYRFF
ncbi:hypothetical protein N561_02210 [Gallibacterium anatis 12656/12]|uniref:Uncharacterized protein n=1 Tax=Gallibacterium anatis 12656/12 TaxID=1195244 RepID=U1IAG0_9PAST|nr:hypothetical protein N561_02210 [Gallibacterium anatis 12656/12]